MVLSRDLTILVPVDISASETPSLSILDLLGPIDVVLLGYFPVPSQAEPALIKDEYGAESTRRLADIVAGRQRVTDVLVFTHDRTATIDRIADEYDCDAVLAGGDTTAIGRILVPLRGDVNLERIVSVVADLLLASEATVTLFHAIPEDTDPSQGEFLLRGASDRIADFGVETDRIHRRLSEGGDPVAEIIALGSEFDLVILGETEPSLRERIIGDVPSRIIEDIEIPALIVRDVA
ncbi:MULTISPECIES: universal stress protein [unclassified Haladaptatus]|uniref:universal stress protein n=1 Tax=unclassified Haladaptatus TaxID=2622732 RepID=UPI0023E8C7E4|nr:MULTISPECIES: universal stress protein [unclassified Haladaptatus]